MSHTQITRQQSTSPRAKLLTLVRTSAVVLVFVLALAAIASGVGTTQHPNLANDSVLVWVYYTGGLFVFGGLDLGTPTGAGELGRIALWIAFFLAPLITTSAVAEAFARITKPGWSRKRRLQDHIIVVGAGQIGSLYSEAIREADPSRQILVVDRNPHVATSSEALALSGVQFLQGDVRRNATLDAMRLDRARAVVFVTEDDLVNLEAAWAAWDKCPALHIATHVADLTLLRPVERVTEEDNAPRGFNTHRIGAEHLYRTHLAKHFRATGYKDIVVLVGFGRFAQTLLELMLAEESENLESIIVVDHDASFFFRRFQVDILEPAERVTVLDGDPIDPATWKSVEALVANSEATPVYLLGGSSEVNNMRAAMLLRQHSAECRIFARCFHRSTFVTSLSEQLGVELLSFEDLLRASLREHYVESLARG